MIVIESVWSAVDELIHELGSVRAFLNEVEAMPEASHAPQVEQVRGAMAEATDAITRIFAHGDDLLVEAAWEAMARAQDAVSVARDLVTRARTSQETSWRMRQANLEQMARAREQAEVIARQAERVRLKLICPASPPSPAHEPAADEPAPARPGPSETDHSAKH